MLIKFCLYGFLKNLKFFEPFFIPYLLIRGVDLGEIGLLISIRWAVVFFMEIPSGIIADYLGKKNSMLVCFSGYIAGFLILGFQQSFWIYSIGMLFFGIGEAFRSGTHKAIIFDWLEAENREKEKTKVYSITRSFSQMGAALSSLIGMGLILWQGSLNIIFLASVIPYILGFSLILSYPPDKKETSHQNTVSLKEHLNFFYRELRKPALKKLLISNSLLESGFKMSKDFIQPLILESALFISLFNLSSASRKQAIILGISYFIFYSISTLSSRISYQIPGCPEKRGTQFYFALILVFSVLPVINGFYTLFFSCMIFVLYNLRKPLMVTVYGNLSSKNQRAGVLSVDSQLQGLWNMILAPILGYSMKWWGGKGFLVLPAILLILHFITQSKKTITEEHTAP